MFKKNIITYDGEPSIQVTGLGEYSLTDTMECGQCFRYERIERADGHAEYMTVVGDHLIRVAQTKGGELVFKGMSDELFESVARPYFNLDLALNAVRDDVVAHTDSEWLRSAADFASGIAILRQDPWESLVSFIISQNNNIPRIRKIIREISSAYGKLKNDNISCPLGSISGVPNDEKCRTCGRCYSFPSPIDILDYPEGLLPSKPGFRYGYILDAAEKVHSGEVNLKAIEMCGSYEYTLSELKKIKGVGDKVASCVALFGFACYEAFPIDVWMKRAIDTYFDGVLDPTTLGSYAGIAQQYIFHYIRNIEKN